MAIFRADGPYVDGESDPSLTVVRTSFENANGEFEVTGLDPGRWAVSVWIGGAARWSGSVERMSGGVHEIEASIPAKKGPPR